ncbi:hypothetical protein TRV_00053 [Trichophyton verrucosum HKI 0517]|uniref:Aminoglycoside phosphotransferase domain-containing protein n=1 Tax=Trichophyton verrucosum (strain HKI 0517) TaxID=663202 RepID=D4CZ16_TRIVH|nr:uncharacterized protein TRV_00053 [Trichophyton verrucosum HKI 0517]EFE45180.1 hypothetical protein TRV_00053 [Trichophyton verrucosum HKI 0517]
MSTASWALGKVGITCLRTARSSTIPNFARIKLYIFTDRLIEYWDPILKEPYVKNLSQGLCLEKSDRNIKNEANALLAVKKITTINAPRLIDFVTIDATRAAQLVTIDFQENPEALLISEFIDCLTRGVTKSRNEPPLSLLYERKYDLCFTPLDLHRSNLFVTRGRLSGIIGWKNAGFKPEYWEFTRSLWPYGGERKLCYIHTYAFDGKYDDELEAEVSILYNSPFVF